MIYKVLFLVWLVLMVFFSVSPNSLGEQYFISKISLTQSGFFQHVLGYIVLSGIAFIAFNKKRFWLILFAVLMLGVLLEALQSWIPTRAFNKYDLLANSIGIIGVALFVFIKKYIIDRNEN